MGRYTHFLRGEFTLSHSKWKRQLSIHTGNHRIRNNRFCYRRNTCAICADILSCCTFTVYIAFTNSCHSAEGYGYCHTNILGNGERTSTIFHTFASISARYDHRITTAFCNCFPSFRKRCYCNGYAYGSRLIPHCGTSLISISLISIEKHSFNFFILTRYAHISFW